MKHKASLFACLGSLCCTIAPLSMGAWPTTNDVLRYERCDSEFKWREVTRSEGDVVLSCLQKSDTFEQWRMPPDVFAIPLRTYPSFRLIEGLSRTNVVSLSYRAELMFSPQGLLIIPPKEREVLAVMLEKWRDADNKRIASQPLPCQYRIGAADDGSTLSGIARMFYRDASRWREIYEANRTVIKDPDIIRGGEVITIPKLAD